jgi:hypothetical protein
VEGERKLRMVVASSNGCFDPWFVLLLSLSLVSQVIFHSSLQHCAFFFAPPFLFGIFTCVTA